MELIDVVAMLRYGERSPAAINASLRQFSTAENALILDAYEAASTIECVALLRRERIYSSHIAAWRNNA